MIGELPEHLTVGDTDYHIRSDYRNVIQVFEAFNDEDMEDWEKWVVAFWNLFEDFTCIDDVLEAIENGFPVEDAIKQINWFITAGKAQGKNAELPVFDWEQDEQIIFSSVNKVLGVFVDVRTIPYMHWWTFLGYFNEIGEGEFSFISGIRHKLNKCQKLERHEKEFLNNNKDRVTLKKRMTKEEREAEEAYQAKIKRVLGL